MGTNFCGFYLWGWSEKWRMELLPAQTMLGKVMGLVLLNTRCSEHWVPDTCYRKLTESSLEMGSSLLSEA